LNTERKPSHSRELTSTLPPSKYASRRRVGVYAMNPETRPLFLRCTADGKRFLMTTNSEASEGESAPVTVVLNWAAGLKK
jgi:hypothetical protein